MIRLKRLRKRCPSRWAADYSVRLADGDFIRQLADGRKVARNVLVDGRMMDKVRTTILGVEDNHLPSEFLPDEVKGCGKVGVPADENKGLDVGCVGVAKHFCDDVGVGALLFKLHYMDTLVFSCYFAVRTPCVNGRKPRLVFIVVSENRFNSAFCREGLEMEVLPFNRGGIVWVGFNVRGEILDGVYRMVFPDEVQTETAKIKPLQFGMPLEQTEIQISPVDIDVCFHGYEEGPGFFKRGPRSALAEPCGWMAHTIANSVERCKGAERRVLLGTDA